MKRAMILFAKGFPYNVSEPFLEKEYPKYGTYFDHVLVVTGCKKEKNRQDRSKMIHWNLSMTTH